MDLRAFLAPNALPMEETKYAASKRFVGEDGKPMEWVIGCIDGEENEALMNACTKRVPVPGRRGQYTKETDYTAYAVKLAVRCTSYPNLNDAELQDSYKAMGAEALLRKMLTSGELAAYLQKVQEVNDFDIPFEEQVDDAKN